MTQPLFSLKVPATTANLGSGFDTLGMALTLYNVFSVTELLPDGTFACEVCGEGMDELQDARENMVVTSYLRACQEWKLSPRGFHLESCNAVPLNRGLGSSSTAVVAGVTLAGLVKLKGQGKLPEGITVTMVLTGNGLKDPDTAIENLKQSGGAKPIEIGDTEEELMCVLERRK